MINKPNNLPIVVLTPIRNNEWILKAFLEVTSRFADLIIIFDQASEDNSKSICKSFGKVDYNFISSKEWLGTKLRILPIERARKLIPGRKLLLGLDVDEILTANSLNSKDWDLIREADNGTIIRFEKPDLYNGYDTVIRYPNSYFPLGIVDNDKIEYSKSSHNIHTHRIPFNESLKQLEVKNIKFLHYGLCNLKLQKSKERFYAVLEYTEKSNFSYLETIKLNYRYRQNYNYKSQGDYKASQDNWFKEWERKGIKVRNFNCDKFNWFDYQTMLYFKGLDFPNIGSSIFGTTIGRVA